MGFSSELRFSAAFHTYVSGWLDPSDPPFQGRVAAAAAGGVILAPHKPDMHQ